MDVGCYEEGNTYLNFNDITTYFGYRTAMTFLLKLYAVVGVMTWLFGIEIIHHDRCKFVQVMGYQISRPIPSRTNQKQCKRIIIPILVDDHHRNNCCCEKRFTNTCLMMSNKMSDNNNDDTTTEYRNVATQFLSNFMMNKNNNKNSNSKDSIVETSSNQQNEKLEQQNSKEDIPIIAQPETSTISSIDQIDLDAPKLIRNIDDSFVNYITKLAQILDYELYEKEWFVTGNVNPIYFSNTFQFQDPDVKLNGIKEYAYGVRKLFDQRTSRAEIISTNVNLDRGPNIITCTWRLSGNVNIGPGLTIKPYIVYTDFTIDETTGLIVFQEDRFSVPQWDILLSALFPFLIGSITSKPAPPVEPRIVPKIIQPELLTPYFLK